ncbi:MAG TPA: hypothetical protein VGS20_09835 [Candidatus Acidoferrales bacterium]|nr:hypothetical protein [Candidatus Acidoferrales bacterium]
MASESLPDLARPASPFTGDDVAGILRERGWLAAMPAEAERALELWLDRAALLLGPQASDRCALGALLEMIFHYDARQILCRVESHEVMARAGARDVVRELARELLAGPDVDSDRLKQLANDLKARTGCQGRTLFHPLRLALAGRAGGGEMDRVVLLLDGAARLPFTPPVKGARERILEFCAALD